MSRLLFKIKKRITIHRVSDPNGDTKYVLVIQMKVKHLFLCLTFEFEKFLSWHSYIVYDNWLNYLHKFIIAR